MAGVKFSAFTTGATTANTLIVGYDSVAGTNNQYTLAQLKTGLGVTTLYDGDGTLSGARDVDMDGNDLTFTYGTGTVYPVINMGKVTIYPNGTTAALSEPVLNIYGKISFTYLGHQGQGLSFASYNTSVVGFGQSMYGGGGWSSNSGYSVVGPDFDSTSGADLTARLGVIGGHNDNTSYAFRVQNSDLTDIFSVNNDTTTTVEKNLVIKGQGYTELHTGTTPLDPDWNNGNIQESTLVAGSSDFDPSNPKAGATYILKLTQPGTADGTVNWDNIGAANIKWPGGTEPTLTASAAAVDIITLICTDATGQGVYYASSTLNMQ